MATKGGTITEKDIIEAEALKFGDKLADQAKVAINAFEDLKKSAKSMADVVSSFRKVDNQNAFLDAKRQEQLASQATLNAIKKEEAALISIEKIKRQSIATSEVERKAVEAAAASADKANKIKEKGIKPTIEQRIQTEMANKAEKQAALEKLGLIGAYAKLNNARTAAKNTLRDLIATEGASIAEIKKAQKAFDDLDAKVKKADNAVREFNKNVGNYPQLQKLGGMLRDLIGAFGLTVGITAFANVLKGAYETIKEFDAAIADLSSITGATGKDLDFFKGKAIELGKSTKGGAVAVVEAYKLIASAQPILLENAEALNQVTEATLLLAKASGMELPAAATALTDAMNQFGVGAENAVAFVDALANGAKYGSAEIPQVTEALLKFGAVARSSNIDIKESTALVELLAENGLKGAEAGTALRNVLLKISAPDALPKKAQAAIEKLGISFAELSDKSTPIQKRLELLKPLLNDNAGLMQTFGLENIVAAQNILEHTDRLAELTGKMGEVGTAEEQAIIRNNTLAGGVDRLDSAWDAYILKMSEASGTTSFLTRAVDFLGNNLEKILDVVFKLAAVFGTYFITMRAVNFVITAYKAIQVASTAAQIAFTTATGIGTVAMKAQAKAAEEAAAATTALNVATKATPWGLIIGLLLATTAAYAAFNDEMSKAEKSQKRLNDESERFKAQETATNKQADEFRDKRFKTIEDEIALRRAKGENSKKLDEEEAARKTKLVLEEMDTYNQSKDFQIKDTENQIALSQKRIAQFEKEKSALIKSNYRVSKQGRNEGELSDLISNSKEDLKSLQTSLENNRKITADEKGKLNNLLKDLNQKAAVDQAAAANEESKKEHAARLKRLKEKYDAEKKSADDLFKLQQYRLGVAIELNRDIFEDEKELMENRVNASYEVEQLLSAQKKAAAENDLKQLGKYNEETGKFMRQLSDQEIKDILETGKTKKILTAEQQQFYETYQNELTGINKKGVKDRAKLEEDAAKKEADRLAAEFTKKLADIQGYEEEANKIGDIRTTSLKRRLSEGKISEKEYEDELLKIKNDAAKQSLNSQLDYITEELVALAETEEQKIAIIQATSNIKKKLSEEDVQQVIEAEALKKQKFLEGIQDSTNLIADAFKINADNLNGFFENIYDNFTKLLKGGKFTVEDFAESAKLAIAIVSDVANSMFAQNIANIDAEIEKNNEYYEKQITAAGDDQRKKAALQKEQTKQNDILEKKKKEEQRKQAVFNKALAITQATINLGLAVTAALATTPPASFALAILTAGLAGIALASVVAAPIPKYKTGRKGGPAELAVINDGGVTEVVSRPDGSNPRRTEKRNALVHLLENDMVHTSEDAYRKHIRALRLKKVQSQGQRMNDYQTALASENGHSKELLEELKRNTKAVQNSKSNVTVNVPKPQDLNHEFWRAQRTNWNL